MLEGNQSRCLWIYFSVSTDHRNREEEGRRRRADVGMENSCGSHSAGCCLWWGDMGGKRSEKVDVCVVQLAGQGDVRTV